MNQVVVKKSRAGLGLYANQDFKKGEQIIEYIGETITEDEANERGGKYLLTLDSERVIDGKSRTNIARYINHACKPNCFFELNEAETRAFAIAKKAIKAGEELTVHYGKDYFEQYIEPTGCRCSSCTS